MIYKEIVTTKGSTTYQPVNIERSFKGNIFRLRLTDIIHTHTNDVPTVDRVMEYEYFNNVMWLDTTKKNTVTFKNSQSGQQKTIEINTLFFDVENNFNADECYLDLNINTLGLFSTVSLSGYAKTFEVKFQTNDNNEVLFDNYCRNVTISSSKSTWFVGGRNRIDTICIQANSGNASDIKIADLDFTYIKYREYQNNSHQYPLYRYYNLSAGEIITFKGDINLLCVFGDVADKYKVSAICKSKEMKIG